jgi:sugar lactone lactonase YvrE
LKYDAQFNHTGTFPDAKERDVSRILVDGEGAIYLLSDDEKSVRVYDEAGRLVRAVLAKGSGYELKHPVDIAVDPFRNLYVADEELGVLVFSPAGQLVTTLAAELRRPEALTLDADGAVLVYDQRAERVLRFK